MRERPILFSAPMVRAILEGRKTQTRRVVKAKHLPFLQNIVGGFLDGKWNQRPMPYGQPGDRLWVREKHALEHCVDGNDPPFSDGRPTMWRTEDDVDCIQPWWTQAHYHATDPAPDLCCERENCAQCRDNDMGPHWRPSIHMPRWASRITLEVTAVRVERLQDISEADANAEGADAAPDFRNALNHPQAMSYRAGFAQLWESINGAGSWNANPWVRVIEFRRIEQELRAA